MVINIDVQLQSCMGNRAVGRASLKVTYFIDCSKLLFPLPQLFRGMQNDSIHDAQ